MKPFAAALVFSLAALAQSAPPVTEAAPELTSNGAPLHVPYACPADDLEWAGLACQDTPCPIYLELSHADALGKIILLTGNIHSTASTLASVLLRSDNSGKTWNEPQPRIRGAALELIQFGDPQHAVISGEQLQPIPLDPFFLATADAGARWHKVNLYEDEGTPGVILRFYLDSKDHGLALVERQGEENPFELFETQTAGDTWSIREKTDQQPKLAVPDSAWRVREDGKVFRLEHQEGSIWAPFAAFVSHIADCKIAPPPDQPEPAAEPAAPTTDAVQELQLGKPATPAKKQKPQ